MKGKEIFLLACLFFLSVSCTKKAPEEEKSSFPVTVTKVSQKTVPLYIETIGHIESYQKVNIMAQVDGQLIKTCFEEGADVKQGDLLFLIDNRPYLANVKEKQGALKQSLADLKYARSTLERNSKLAVDNYISQDTFDRLIADVESKEGLSQENEGNLQNAQIDLGYTAIYSPLDAKTGARLVYDGDLILKNAQTPLVTLNQIQPIYATFFINEKNLFQLQYSQKKKGPLHIIVQTEDPQSPEFYGELTFIDNQVDLATGMIKLKATFQNQEKLLWPNQYVRVKLILDLIEDALLIPVETIQNNTKGKYVFVVTKENQVEIRLIEVGQRQENNTIVVTKGLKKGEVIVKEGQLNLSNGAKITIGSK